MHETIRQLHRRLYFFPIVLLCADAIFSAYCLLAEKTNRPAFYLFSAGVFTGWFLFVTGVVSFFLLKASNLAKGVAFIHGFINSMALLVLTVLWEQKAKGSPVAKPPEAPELVIKFLMIALLVAGSFLGRSALRKHLK
jgi:uncharacterized membrane protein